MAKLINLVRSSTKCTVSLVYSRTDLSVLQGTLVQKKIDQICHGAYPIHPAKRAS